MDQVLVLNKQVSETPLECMDRFRVANPEYANVKMTYAGRLDPMADGVLVVLVGDAVVRKDEFLGLDKEYICTAILGVATDTYDILGRILPLQRGGGSDAVRVLASLTEGSGADTKNTDPSASQSLGTSPLQGEDIARILKSFICAFEQSYPPYSSKTINGVQMHTLAREGKLDDVVAPKRMVTVHDVSDISVETISRNDVVVDIVERIQKVKGDFRQDEIIADWRELGGDALQTVSFKIIVSSGTYIRGIVHELGKQLGCGLPAGQAGACIWKLTRVRVGNYRL